MDTVKAILNQILLSFDSMNERLKRLPSRGRRRVMLLLAVLVLFLVLLLILSISSCRSSATAVTAGDLQNEARTRVRQTVGPEEQVQSSLELGTSYYAEAHPISSPADVDVTWPPPEATDLPYTKIEATSEPSSAPESEAPQVTPEPTPQYATLKKHDKSEAVTTLQYRLMELGYLDIDEPTNYFGSSTETGVILFQRQHGLKQDGIAGNETQTILYGDSAEKYCLKEGAEGQDVKALQEQLVDLGYLAEKDVDRVYGPVTVAAVEAFQKRNSLHVDGLAGEKTLEVLYSDSAKISKELQKQQEAEAAAKKKAEQEAKKKTAKPTAKPTATPKKDTRIDKFIAAAQSKLGCEYVLGGRGPDRFDCSGLVYWCLKQAGISGTRLNALGYSRVSSWTKIESVGSLKRGDIIFFKSDTNSTVNHTGIYIGGGEMIDASSGNGKVVRRPLSAYWKRNFVCARRPWRD